jgi:hypothetical protein
VPLPFYLSLTFKKVRTLHAECYQNSEEGIQR